MHKSTHRNNRINNHLYADYKNLKGALADTTLDVKDKFGEIFTHSLEGIKTKSTDVSDNVADYVAERPFRSLGIALIAGLLLGYLLKKK